MLNKKDFAFLLKGIFQINDEDGRLVKFFLNKSQKLVLDRILQDLESKGNCKIIIIKGRQQGITTFCQILGLNLIMVIKGFQVYTMVHDSNIATDIFERMVKKTFSKLPQVIRDFFDVNRNNKRQLMFNNRDKASITVGLSGRGGTYQFKHISEAGKMSMNEGLWQEMIEGTLEAGRSVIEIIESTPDGGLGRFYDYVQENIDNVLFLPWTLKDENQMTPPESDSWVVDYERLARNYKLSLDPVAEFQLTKEQFFWYYNKAKKLQENVKVQYPNCLEEAFVSNSDTIIDIDTIIELDKNKSEPIRINDGVKVYVDPEPGHYYSIGIDPATGVGKDDTAITVIDCITREQVVVVSGKIDTELAITYIINLWKVYNKPVITWERNGIGWSITEALVKIDALQNYLYKSYEVDPSSQTSVRIPKYGFVTSSKTKPVMVNDLKNLLQEGNQKLNDPITIKQLKTWVRKDNGKTEHEDGYHDDCIDAVMLANEGVKYWSEYM
jgi:Terminase RNaseH-like domain